MLKKNYEKDNLSNPVSLLRQLSAKKFKDGQFMDNNIADSLDIIDLLHDIVEKFKDHKVVTFLLQSLPDNYNTIVSAFGKKNLLLVLYALKEKLLQEDKRQTEDSTSQKFVLKTEFKKKANLFPI